MCKLTLTWSITKPLTCIVANCCSFLACWIFKLIKYFPTFTLGFATIALCCPTCFCKSSNFGTSNLCFFSTELQTLQFTMDSLPLGTITTFAQGNFVVQISWNTLFSSHLAFLVFFVYGTIWSKSSEIGFLAPIVLKEKTLVIYKDLLLPSCSSKEWSNKILVSATIDLELEEGLTRTREKKSLNLKFIGGFSGTIWGGMQDN